MARSISWRVLAAAAGGLAVFGGLVAGYASTVEPHWPEIVRITLPLARLPGTLDGLTLAHISDLHAGMRMDAAKIGRLVSMVNGLEPCIVVTTGDMFSYSAEEARMCARELAALQAPLGVYVAMGNHERRLPPQLGEAPFLQAMRL